MLDQDDKKSNRFERFAPEITALAVVLDDEVRYSRRAWRLVHCDRELWDSDCRGPLTPDGARAVVEELRQELAEALPFRCASRLQRAESGIQALREFRFSGSGTLTACTLAMDHTAIRHDGKGAWDGWVALGRDRVEARATTKQECLDRLSEAALLRWGTPAEVAN